MSEGLIQKLLAKVDKADRAELIILHNAVSKCAKSYHEESTTARLKDWQGAKEALADFLFELKARYNLADAEVPLSHRGNGERAAAQQSCRGGSWVEKTYTDAGKASIPKFTKTKQQTGKGSVLEQLKAAGYQIGKSKLNKDVKDGKLAKDKGFFTPARIRKYAELLPRVDTGQTDKDYQSSLAREKAEEEVKKLQIQNRREERKEAEEIGRLVPRADFERELAARFVVLHSDSTRMAQSRAPEFVHLVSGDMKKSDDLAAALVAAMDELLHQYASVKKFHVLIQPPKKEERDEY